jgi:PTS system D-glucosamine-specific IIC component
MKDKIFGILQRVGRSFMLPIAILPVAGLLLGIGQSFTNETMLQAYGLMNVMGPGTIPYAILKVCGDCGNVVFGNLPLVFAIGVAIGMAKAEKEVAALSAAIAFFIMHTATASMITINGGAEMMKDGAVTSVLGIESLQMGVFGGIIVGLGVAALHNKFYKIKLPDVLSFFGGTRFVPIISTIVYVFVGILMFFIWPPIQNAMYAVGGVVRSSGYIGTFIYGVMERALIPFGLHHVFYLPFWQTSLGGTMEVAGKVVEGAQNIFFAQLADSSTTHFSVEATRFMTGKFPLMIFGLPGAALAMYRCAKPEKRKVVGGLLISAALTSMLTGITEPLEFTFLFVAPLLYVIHCVFAGLAYMLMHILKVCVGMTFSGGIIDMLLFGTLQGQSKTNWMMFIPVGIVYFIVYYLIFSTLIKKLDLKTPGREDEGEETKLYTKADYQNKGKDGSSAGGSDALSEQIMMGLGGKKNISDVDCCATRLRITVVDGTKVNDGILKGTGASGVVHRGNGIQIIYGPRVNIIKSDFEEYLKTAPDTVEVAAPAVEENKTTQEAKPTGKVKNTFVLSSPMTGVAASITEAPDEAFAGKMMGDGAVVTPTEGLVVAPCDGDIAFVFPSKHAVGMSASNGMELLIHVGIDTVNLDGKGFEALVKDGDSVKKGDPLLKVDLDFVKANAPSITSPVIFTALDDNQVVRVLANGNVKSGEDLIAIDTYE